MNAHTTYRFAGLDAPSSDPVWYRKMNGSTEPPSRSFVQAVDELHDDYRAQQRPVAYWDDQLDEWVQTNRHVALVNPALLGRDPDSASSPDDACWSIPTRMYDIVNPNVYVHLADVLRGLDGDDVYGEVRLHRWGGEVHIDVFVPDFTIVKPGSDPLEQDDQLVLGLTTGYDFFGGHKLYAEVIAADPSNGSVMRGLTDPEKRRHAKSRSENEGDTAATVADWWEAIVDQFDVVSDALFEVIFEARDHEIDLRDVACEPFEFFAALGVPGYIAEATVDRLEVNGHVPQVFDAWTAYRALTRSITDDYRGKTGGSSMRNLVRVGNDLLNRPAKTEWRALDAHADRFDGQQLTLDDRRARETIRARARTVRENMHEYDSLKSRVKSMLKNAESPENAANASTSTS